MLGTTSPQSSGRLGLQVSSSLVGLGLVLMGSTVHIFSKPVELGRLVAEDDFLTWSPSSNSLEGGGATRSLPPAQQGGQAGADHRR